MAGSKVISQVEVLSASDVGRRRGWTDEDKIRIVEESLRGARQGAPTARRHGISRSLLTRWRREFREGVLRAEGPFGFTPLQIAPEVPRPAREEACCSQSCCSQSGQDRIEVVLTNGRRLVIGAAADLAMVARLVQVLERV
jgi:transposase